MDEDERQVDDAQARLWSGTAGHGWIDAQAVVDEMFAPLADLLVEAASAGPGRRVLDVGCGTGGTTVAVARRLGESGRCVGVDISAPLITAARERAERERSPAAFVHADAQSHPFEPASFDAIVSRFGVMFFDEPVSAFANLRRAAADGGELRFVAWRSAAENPFMTTAERAAAPLLPDLPARRPDAPGQFAFADRERVGRILHESGWADVEIEPLDVDCAFPERELLGYLARLGPVGRALQEADPRTRTRVLEIVRPAFDPYVHGERVRYVAACWDVRARARSAGMK